jgi:hypothetical protein
MRTNTLTGPRFQAAFGKSDDARASESDFFKVSFLFVQLTTLPNEGRTLALAMKRTATAICATSV